MFLVKQIVVCSALWLSGVALAMPGKNGDTGGNGGDAITAGSAAKVFDKVEFDDPIIPDKLGAPWDIVDTQLKALATKLPQTSDYLRSFFVGGRMVWWFVNVELKPIDDSGKTNVLVAITQNQEQVAANENNYVQIRRDIWDKLSDDDRATLLIHEMLWSAIGAKYVADGSPIRKLSRYIMHPGLSDFELGHVISIFKNVISRESKLSYYINDDIKASTTPQKFKGQIVYSGTKAQLVTTVVGSSPIRNLKISTFNPNPTFESIGYCSQPMNFTEGLYHINNVFRPFGDWLMGIYTHCKDLKSSGFVGLLKGFPTQWSYYENRRERDGQLNAWRYDTLEKLPDYVLQYRKIFSDANRLCTELSYAGHSNWRLPAPAEISELNRLGILTSHVLGDPPLGRGDPLSYVSVWKLNGEPANPYLAHITEVVPDFHIPYSYTSDPKFYSSDDYKVTVNRSFPYNLVINSQSEVQPFEGSSALIPKDGLMLVIPKVNYFCVAD
jgi:hypothetical protein